MAKKKMTFEEKLDEAIVKDATYEVPENWTWTYMNNIGEYINGKAFKPIDWDTKGLPIIRIQNLTGTNNEFNYFSGEIEEKYKIVNNDLLMAWSATLDAFLWNGNDAVLNQHIFKVRSLINKKYHYYLLKNTIQEMYSKTHGTGMVHITKGKFEKLEVPLPPLKEQQRIVDKIESLFEKLDKAKELIEEARDDFEKRKTAILEKAFRGELTKEWRIKNRTDRCYDVLMHEIKNRNEIYSKVNKKNKPNFMNYGENDILIDKNLPGNWIKCPVGLICDCIVPGRDKPKSFTGDIPWITIPNVISDYINTNSSELKLSDAEIQEVNAKVIPIKSVIMSCVGRFGISAIVDKSCVINQQLHAFLPYEKLINPKFLMYHIRILRTYMESIATSTTIAYVNKSGCNSLPINLPPIEEQKEIVRILDKLLEEESKIEELTVLEEQIELIKKSILAKVFRGQLGTNCEDDENALELLKEILNKE